MCTWFFRYLLETNTILNTHTQLQLCMYVCMHVCMYVYMYVCTYVWLVGWMVGWMDVCTYVRMYVCRSVYAYIYIYNTQFHIASQQIQDTIYNQHNIYIYIYIYTCVILYIPLSKNIMLTYDICTNQQLLLCTILPSSGWRIMPWT